MEERMENNNRTELDQKKIKRLLKKIVIAEKTNLKTKQYSYGPMVNKIKKMIEEEVECY
jgi:hypothetical protein